MFISQEVGFDKPAREFFERAFAEIPDFSREMAVIVGDSLTSDILGGKNAGIETVWFNPKGLPTKNGITPDHTISHLDELIPLLERL
jgi:FMN phosphatase YigB (HAD superfamily)